MNNDEDLNFNKNKELDDIIVYINNLLEPVELERIQSLSAKIKENFPTLFLIGTPRCGSTLFMQWIASTGLFAYPSNFLSRFNRAPYIAALIYNMITDPKYQYLNEFSDIRTKIEFSSSIGKTSGFIAPHEFWYFWRRFIPFSKIPYSEEDFSKHFDFNMFANELKLLKHAFRKPFFMKGQIINWYLESMSKRVKNSVYVHLHRDPIASARSLLKAREKRNGNREEWFSSKPREFKSLIKMNPYYQVAGQVYFINREIYLKRNNLGDTYIYVRYENFCNNPEEIYKVLTGYIQSHYPLFTPTEYHGVEKFKVSDPVSDEDEKLGEAYNYFKKNMEVSVSDASRNI